MVPSSRSSLLAAALLAVISIPASVWANQQATSPEDWDAATIYARACAACHGADGSGIAPDHPNYKNFNPPPADLTDPLFNSREPAADWFLVTKYGGKRLGLSDQMPAYGQALSDEKIDEVVVHIKTLADTSRFPPGDLNFLRPIATIKAFPEDEGLIINRFARNSEDKPDVLRTTAYYARRFGARYQGEIKLDYLNQQGGPDSLGVLELGFKWAVHDNLARQMINTLGIELAIPVDDAEASDVVIPYYSFGKGVSDSVTFQGTLKTRLPTSGADNGEAELTVVFHWMPSPWPRSVSPALEFRVTEPFTSDRDTRFTTIPQLYAGLSKGGHVALAGGVELPISDLPYDYRIHVFLLWDIADGPFWAGW